MRRKYIAFDAFGTLFKTADFMEDIREVVGPKAEHMVQLWRQKQLEYTWLLNQMQRFEPFDRVTARALNTAMHSYHISNPEVIEQLLSIFDNPELISGAEKCIKIMKAKGMHMAILSNGTRQMLRRGVDKTGVASFLDFLISVDEVQVFKPDPKVYALVPEKFGVRKEEVLFCSSNQWDVAGASSFGLRTIWLNQRSETREDLPFADVTEVLSLDELEALFS